MADFEAPSFSLGLDLELGFDSEPQPDAGGAKKGSLQDLAGTNLTVEFELHVSDSDPEVSAPALKRLRRGPGRVRMGRLAEASWRCDVDEEIEEFSSQEDLRRDEHPSTQYQSVCSSSKVPLRAPGVLTSQTASHRKAKKREQPSNHPASSSLETSSSKLMFPKLTVSPLRRFQLLDSDSDSDDPSISEVKIQEAEKSHPSAKVGWSYNRQYSSASEEKSTRTSVSMPQNVDLWKDFHPSTSVSIPTPVLDEVCDEYFRSVKGKNVTVKPGIDGCMGNKRIKNRTKIVQHQSDLADPLPPANRYFFHDDPRIQTLVRSRLLHFSPLGVASNTNMQHGASVIDYMGQFGHGETSKVVNQDVDIERSTTKSKKSARKLNSEGALNASGSKNSAGIPKKAGNKQVHVNGQSAGKWYTSPEGRKVYVTKGGQELTGSIAYRHYKKDSGGRFKKSKRKTTAKRNSKKKKKT